MKSIRCSASPPVVGLWRRDGVATLELYPTLTPRVCHRSVSSLVASYSFADSPMDCCPDYSTVAGLVIIFILFASVLYRAP